ncbi:hypothetical protein PINS_up012263 [Pythium insidiosum]|nr:hypothetical protein PINS_up012263 [Pythium insidiosum]
MSLQLKEAKEAKNYERDERRKLEKKVDRLEQKIEGLMEQRDRLRDRLHDEEREARSLRDQILSMQYASRAFGNQYTSDRPTYRAPARTSYPPFPAASRWDNPETTSPLFPPPSFNVEDNGEN